MKIVLLFVAFFASAAHGAHHHDLRQYARIAARPSITRSAHYVSPAEAEPRFARATAADEDDYANGYKTFLDQYFAESTARRPDYSGEAETRSAALTQKQQNAGDDDDDDGGDDEETNNDAFEAVPNSDQTEANDDADDHPQSPRIYDQKFHDAEYERIREASKQQEKEINAHNPKHCRIEYKDGMECSVCKNPKTGAHSQSCSFSSTAPSKKYAYTKERNYNSRDQDADEDDKAAATAAEDDADDVEDDEDQEEEEVVHKSPKKPKKSTTPKKKNSSGSGANKPFRPSQQRSQQLRSDDWRPILEPLHYRSSRSYSAQATEQHASVVDAEPFLFGVRTSDRLTEQKHRKRETKAKKAKQQQKADAADEDDVYDGFSFERFFGRDFPEARSAGLIRAVDADDDNDDDGTPSAVEFLPDYESKQNVEQVLADFKKRDWSQCDRKVRDGGLTCYVCHDERGVRHEECMFVSGDEAAATPKRASHLSYTETKEYHGGDDGDAEDDGGRKSAALTKKPTGTAKKTAKSKRRQEVEEADDDDEEEDEEEAKPVRKNVHKTRKVLAVQRRRSSRLRDADVGEHQAQASTSSRSIKRMTADTADPVATAASSVVLSHASYEHTIRHHHDG